MIGKKNRCSNYNVVTTPHAYLSTEPVSIRINSNVIGGFRQWVKFSGLTLGEATGAAMLEYMQNHPQTQIKLNVIPNLEAYALDVKTRLRNKIIKDKICSVVATLQRIQETGRGDKASFGQQLQKLVLQATNLKHPDADLVELLKEAERWL
jgi:hypothetical protein